MPRTTARPANRRLMESQARFIKRLPPEDRKHVFLDSLIELGHTITVESHTVRETKEPFDAEMYEAMVRDLVGGFMPIVPDDMQGEIEGIARIAYHRVLTRPDFQRRGDSRDIAELYREMKALYGVALRIKRSSAVEIGENETTDSFASVFQAYEPRNPNDLHFETANVSHTFAFVRDLTVSMFTFGAFPEALYTSDSLASSVSCMANIHQSRTPYLEDTNNIVPKNTMENRQRLADFVLAKRRRLREYPEFAATSDGAARMFILSICRTFAYYLTSAGTFLKEVADENVFWVRLEQLFEMSLKLRLAYLKDKNNACRGLNIQSIDYTNNLRKLLIEDRWLGLRSLNGTIQNYLDSAYRFLTTYEASLNVVVPKRDEFAFAVATLIRDGNAVAPLHITQSTNGSGQYVLGDYVKDFATRVASLMTYFAWFRQKSLHASTERLHPGRGFRGIDVRVTLSSLHNMLQESLMYGDCTVESAVQYLFNKVRQGNYSVGDPDERHDNVAAEPMALIASNYREELPPVPSVTDFPEHFVRKTTVRDVKRANFVRVTAEFTDEQGSSPRTIAFACDSEGEYVAPSPQNSGRGKTSSNVRGLSIVSCLRNMGFTLVNPEEI